MRVRVKAREVECRVWRVGRYAIAPLYLLEPTDPRDLWITRRLYDPRPDCRVAQEMMPIMASEWPTMYLVPA